MNYKIITEAGLTQSEAAIIFGVSRLMTNRYLNGKATPGRHTEPRVKHSLNIIAKLVEQGKLPLSHTDHARRKAAAEKIANHVKSTLAYA